MIAQNDGLIKKEELDMIEREKSTMRRKIEKKSAALIVFFHDVRCLTGYDCIPSWANCFPALMADRLFVQQRVCHPPPPRETQRP